VTWYFPHQNPDNFISSPLQGDISSHEGTSENLPIDRTYHRQFLNLISQVSSTNQASVERSFHRISVAFAQSEIPTSK